MGYKTEEMSKSTAKTYILDVTGMSCGSCAKTLEKAVTDHLTASKPGILTSVKADSTANTVTIQTTQCMAVPRTAAAVNAAPARRVRMAPVVVTTRKEAAPVASVILASAANAACLSSSR